MADKGVLPTKRTGRLARGASLAWLGNVGLLIAATAWIYCDGASLHYLRQLGAAAGGSADAWQWKNPSVWCLAASAVAWCIMLISLFVGPARYRTTRSWLYFTALACGWLTLGACWPGLYWRGQQHRVAANLAEIERFADDLQQRWPDTEGECLGADAVLAYPRPNPTTLLVVGAAEFPQTGLLFSAVERSVGDVLRFSLAGRETGAWIERRPDGSQPGSFRSGLEVDYELSESAQLSPTWHLVRYSAADEAG